MLSCAINISEGRDRAVLDALARVAGEALLDLHADPWHHRSVLTLGGDSVGTAARRLAAYAASAIDLRRHEGVHPRLGVVDVVPFTPFPAYLTPSQTTNFPPHALEPAPLDEALAAREQFLSFACNELGLPAYRYGPERTLPAVRRLVREGLAPDCGPAVPDPARGRCCIGARGALVAYNLVLAEADLGAALRIAATIRSPELRALGLAVGEQVQVSCNLIEPHLLGPADAYRLVSDRAPVARAELVGLVPAAILDAVPVERWQLLGLAETSTLEYRLAAR